ncbi:MAG: M48 family metallopeptidase, partial [Gammaproteobacteria bacterium]|nr:M48 family metallopeptidase [Gammaproteobacteria bacterium]
MNFFAAQDRARRSTRRLVFVYLLAAALIVVGVTLVVGVALFNFSAAGYGVTLSGFLSQQAPILLTTAIAASLLIVGATLYKTAVLSAGGGRVARDLGGTQISNDVGDPLRQRLRNVVEEMAIASGVPVPEIYVLEHESGINAFAAGYAPGDAAIAVTRGALELLERDELQGVIGHEFSHILNGDMRLNIRLMGVLFGIMVLGLIGRMVLRGGRYGALSSSRRSRGAPAVLVIGLGLAVLGGIGVFFARIIKASVSRQREYLADASAVQFARQSGGLANALKKIGGYDEGSYLRATDPEEVSHMLFGTGSRLSSLFATHPPLTERIQALDPSFKASDYPAVDLRSRRLAQTAADSPQGQAGHTSAIAAVTATVSPAAVAESVGQPSQEQLEYASRLRQSVPENLYDAAHSSELAYLLTIALILDRDGRVLDRQLALADDRLGPQRAGFVRRYYNELLETGEEYRLPLLEIAFPALRRRPAPQLGYLIDLAGRMIEIDGDIDLYEYCFYRVLVSSLKQAIEPSQPQRQRRATRKPVRDAAVSLLRIVAQYGHKTDAE